MRPKKQWEISQLEYEQVTHKAKQKERWTELPRCWVRIVVDGNGFYVPAFKEEDWEALK